MSRSPPGPPPAAPHPGQRPRPGQPPPPPEGHTGKSSPPEFAPKGKKKFPVQTSFRWFINGLLPPGSEQ